jgi:hypothetical protein
MQSTLPSYDESAVMDASSVARYAMDSKLMVNFYVRAVQNNFKTSQEGRPIFDEVEFIRIIIPGDTKTIIDTKVNPEYRHRFADKYERFQKGLAQAQSGTPLEVWPQMTVGQVAELKAMHISTVEQLADLSDVLAQKIMGSHQLRQKAQAFLEAAAGEAQNSKMAAELEKRDVEIAALKEQMAQILKVKAKPDSPKAA